jgi:hypothetical protein
VPTLSTNAIRLQVKTLQTDLAKITPMAVISNPKIITEPAQKCAEILHQLLDLIDHLSAPKNGGNDE